MLLDVLFTHIFPILNHGYPCHSLMAAKIIIKKLRIKPIGGEYELNTRWSNTSIEIVKGTLPSILMTQWLCSFLRTLSGSVKIKPLEQGCSIFH